MDPSLESLDFYAQLELQIEAWKLERTLCGKEERLLGSGEEKNTGDMKGERRTKGRDLHWKNMVGV